MIFTPEHIHLMRIGRKTMTRRLVKDRENGHGQNHRPPYSTGQERAVQPGRGKRAIARIRLTEVRREPLEQIAGRPDDVRAEGFSQLHEFAGAFLAINDPQFEERHIERITPEDLVEHLINRHGHKPVWVVTFQWIDEQPLFLAPAGGYTTDPHRALRDPGDEQHGPPEAVNPDELELLPSAGDAHRRWEKEHARLAAEFDNLPIADQVAHLQQVAKENPGADLHAIEYEIRRQVRRGLRRLGERRAA